MELILAGISSMIVDLDHLTELRRALRTGRFGAKSRSRWHELEGLAVTMLLCLVFELLGFQFSRSLLVGFISHYLLDMLTRSTRPFYPLEKPWYILN